MNKKKDEKRNQPYVDLETGELKEGYLVEDVLEHESIRRVTRQTLEYLQYKDERFFTRYEQMLVDGYVPFQPKKSFVKLYSNEFFAISKELKASEISFLFKLVEHIAIGSNILYRKDKKKKLKRKDIEKLSGLSRSEFYKTLKHFKDELFLCECSDLNGSKQYVLNPYIAFNGRYINKTIKDMFNNYKRRSN